MTSRPVGVARWLALLLAFAMVVAACGESTDGTDSPDGTESPGDGETGAISGPLRVSFLAYGDDMQAWLDELEAGFAELHPDVELTLEIPSLDTYRNTLTTQAQGGSPPDVAQIPTAWLPAFGEAGMLRDWEATFSPDLLAEFNQNLLNGGRFGEELFGLPYGASVRAGYYDVELFEQVGAEPPATWEETIAVARDIKEQTGKIGVFYPARTAENMAAWFAYVYFSHGGRFLDDQGRLHVDRDACVAGLTIWNTMNDEGLLEANLTTQDPTAQRSAMVNGDAAMTFSGPWTIGHYEADAPDREYGTFPIPRGTEEATVGVTDAYVFFQDSQNPEAALAFAEFMMEPDRNLAFVQRRGFLPVYEEHFELSDFREGPIATFTDSLPNAQFVPLHPQWTLLDELGTDAITKMFLDDTGAEAACDEIVTGLEQINS